MLEAQFLSMLVLGFGSFVVGMLPLKLSIEARHKYPLLLSLLLCFGGGVLLATSLVHMLSEVKEKHVRFAELYFCTGFFILYFVDEITHYCIGDTFSKRHDGMMESNHQTIENNEDTLTIKVKSKYGTLPSLQKKQRSKSLLLDRKGSYCEESPLHGKAYSQPMQISDFERLRNAEIGQSRSTDCCRKHNNEYSFLDEGTYRANKSYKQDEYFPIPSTSKEEPDPPHHHQHHHYEKKCHVELGTPCPDNRIGVTGLLVALLVHSIIEGTSIGIQNSSSQVLLVMGAVTCHKLVLSFCLGIELSSVGFESFSFVAAMVLFAVGSPIGIGIGMSLVSPTAGLLTLEGPLQAITGGSLLYVAAFEVLPRERFKWQHKRENKSAGILQLLFVIIGFTIITLLNIFVVSEHEYYEVQNSTVANLTAV